MELGFIRKGDTLIPFDAIQAEELRNLPEGVPLAITVEVQKKKRTNKQNASIHKYLAMLSKALNDAGYDMKQTLKPETEIPWTMENAKEYLWRPIMKALTNKESTTDLETVEVNEVYQVLSKHMAEKFGVSVPFPDRHHLE